MKRVEFPAEDGSVLRGELHQPEGKTRDGWPLVVLLHGLVSSRVEWYDFPARLAHKGWSVLAFDFRGHGESDGPRGHQGVRRAFEDVESALGAMDEEYGVAMTQVGLVGHSLGGALAVSMAMDLPAVQAVVAMAPVSRLSREMNVFERVGYSLIDKVNRPIQWIARRGLRVPYPVEYERLYASRSAVERAEKDQFLQRTVPVDVYGPLVKKLDAVKAARKLTKPTLVLIAEYDAIVGPWNSRAVYHAVAAEQKDLVTIEESGHSMAGDHKSDDVLSHTDRWLRRHLGGARA